MTKRKTKATFIILLLLLALIFLAFYNGLTTTKYTIKSEKLNTTIRIVFLADLHSSIFGKNQQQLISAIKKQNPDLILMSGDIYDDSIPDLGADELISAISPQYPCYYVTGNHEFWTHKVSSIKDKLKSYGVHVLEGNAMIADFHVQSLNICGVDDTEIGQKAFDKQLENAFSEVDSSVYTILLSHRPELFEQYSSLACDLILSGHAHGGQVRVPLFLNGGLFSPNQGYFPKYTTGIYERNSVNMLVSRGLTRRPSKVPRIFNPPELIVIELTPASKLP